MGGKRGKRDEECENSDRETLNHAMHHVGCMISPELNVVQDRVQGKLCTMLGSGQARGQGDITDCGMRSVDCGMGRLT